MNKRIQFGSVHEARLAPRLRDEGFKLVEHEQQPYEVFRYQRQAPDSDVTDEITIYGLEVGWPNTIIILPSTTRDGGFGLKTVKELLPDYATLPIGKDDRWEYQSEEELEAAFDEIVPLVIGPLLDWFKNPVFNPAGLDMTPAQLYSDEENIAWVKQDIERMERKLQKATESGDAHRIERIEGMIEGLRLALTELEGKKT